MFSFVLLVFMLLGCFVCLFGVFVCLLVLLFVICLCFGVRYFERFFSFMSCVVWLLVLCLFFVCMCVAWFVCLFVLFVCLCVAVLPCFMFVVLMCVVCARLFFLALFGLVAGAC